MLPPVMVVLQLQAAYLGTCLLPHTPQRMATTPPPPLTIDSPSDVHAHSTQPHECFPSAVAPTRRRLMRQSVTWTRLARTAIRTVRSSCSCCVTT